MGCALLSGNPGENDGPALLLDGSAAELASTERQGRTEGLGVPVQEYPPLGPVLYDAPAGHAGPSAEGCRSRYRWLRCCVRAGLRDGFRLRGSRAVPRRSDSLSADTVRVPGIHLESSDNLE